MMTLLSGLPFVPVLAFMGGWELLIVGLIVLLLFGSRLPNVMRSLGQSITEFKKGSREGLDDTDSNKTT